MLLLFLLLWFFLSLFPWYLEDRERLSDWSFICWFNPQIAKGGPGWCQKLGTPSVSPVQVVGSAVFQGAYKLDHKRRNWNTNQATYVGSSVPRSSLTAVPNTCPSSLFAWVPWEVDWLIPRQVNRNVGAQFGWWSLLENCWLTGLSVLHFKI